MKFLLRSGPISAVLGFVIWSWMALVTRTIRWQVEGTESARAIWAQPSGTIVAGWHSRILLLPAGWTKEMRHWPGRTAPGAMLISLSPDAEPVTRAIHWLGLEAIRGSKTNRKKRDKAKGGGRAIAEASRLLKAGGAVCITPDGPRGPAEHVGPGPILLAQRAGAKILPYGLAARPAKRLNTWDRFLVPLPFTRGAIVFGEPLQVAKDNDPETLREALQLRLDKAQARADALVSGQDLAEVSTHETPA